MEVNHKELWRNCLEIIKANLSSEQFDTWFSQTESLGYEDGKVTLYVPSDFFREQYEQRFYNILLKAMRRVYGSNVRLQYSLEYIQGDPYSAVTMTSAEPSPTLVNRTIQSMQHNPNPFEPNVQYEEIDSQLNPTYNFENYCVGDSNKLAHSIAEFIADNPQKNDFNPFFLYGCTGVGKTHLIQAIGIRVKEKMPNSRVLYITSRIFENQYGTAVNKKKINDFINFYQSIDVLLIDDIQELSAKHGTQQAFYPIFNYLHQNGKKIDNDKRSSSG